MPSTTMHTRKKQFQAPITSFFGRSDSNASLQRRSSPMSPELSAETQSSLLTVGMRVRKSVPEGYKTHKTVTQPGSLFHSTAPAQTSSQMSNRTVQSTRELMPFCGLHKVGGWGVQQMPFSSAPTIMIRHDENDELSVPGLSTSQNTISSTQGSFSGAIAAIPAAAKKRTYEDDIEDEMDNFFEELDTSDDVSAATPVHDRPIAKMKGSRKTSMPASVSILDGGDFEEAIFLTPMEDVQGYHEGNIWSKNK